MFKTYTIKEYKFKEVSKNKGAIDYLLVDELGVERVITAVAKLGWNKKIKSVHPIYQRETPLVQALAKASVKDTIEIDFTNYNKKHPRVRNNKSNEIASRELLQSLESRTLFGVDKFRLFQLFIISIFSLLLLMTVFSFI